MHILITAATAAELLPAMELFQVSHNQGRKSFYVDTVETGIGSAATAYHTLKALSVKTETPYDLVINVGIAGAFCNSLPTGSVVRVVSDYFGDCGIQTASGFESLFDVNLLHADTFPFKSGKLTPLALSQEWEWKLASLPQAKGVTMQHLVDANLSSPCQTPKADIETMEGAAFFYVCMNERIPCLALRAISNRVGERDKERWNIPMAILGLKKTLISLADIL